MSDWRSRWAAVAAAALIGAMGATATEAAPRPVKEFAISVSEVEHELYPGGPKIQAWGFNQQVRHAPAS